MKVICIGSSSKDIFFPTSEGVVMETPEDLTSQRKIAFELGAKYKIKQRYEVPGGVAANVAQGLARLGVAVGCYSKVGDDALGQWIKAEIGKEGVDMSLVQQANDCVSDLSAILVDTNSGDRTIFSNQKANGGLEIIPEEIAKFDWIFIGDLHGDWEKIIDNILAIAQENNIRVAINPRQSNIHDNVAKIIEVIKKCQVVILNKDEAIEMISSEKTAADALLNDETYLIEELKKMGPAAVALTDGRRGAWAKDAAELLFVGATEDHPVETTGGGDAFAAGFLAAHFKEESLAGCLKYGVANGGSVVKYYGAKEGLLKPEEILGKIKNMEVKKIK